MTILSPHFLPLRGELQSAAYAGAALEIIAAPLRATESSLEKAQVVGPSYPAGCTPRFSRAILASIAPNVRSLSSVWGTAGSRLDLNIRDSHDLKGPQVEHISRPLFPIAPTPPGTPPLPRRGYRPPRRSGRGTAGDAR